MKRPRKWTIRICLLLLLGAIVNVVVAWRIGAPRRPGYWAPRDAQLRAAPPVGAIQTASSQDWHWIIDSGLLRTSDRPLRLVESRTGIGGRYRVLAASLYEFYYGPRLAVWEAGWPALAVSGATAESQTQQSSLWMVKLDMMHPFRPMWPGFAINTVFYATILWVAFISRLALPRHHRLRRIKRGQCPACAYPVGTSDVCTECGAELKHKAETQKAEIRP